MDHKVFLKSLVDFMVSQRSGGYYFVSEDTIRRAFESSSRIKKDAPPSVDDYVGIRIICLNTSHYSLSYDGTASSIRMMIAEANRGPVTDIYGKTTPDYLLVFKGWHIKSSEVFHSYSPHHTGYHGATHLKIDANGVNLEIQVCAKYCHQINEETHNIYKKWVNTKAEDLLWALRRRWASIGTHGYDVPEQEIHGKMLGWRLVDEDSDAFDLPPTVPTHNYLRKSIYGDTYTFEEFNDLIRKVGLQPDEFYVHRYLWQGMGQKKRDELGQALDAKVEGNFDEWFESRMNDKFLGKMERWSLKAVKYMIDNRRAFKILFRVANKGNKRRVVYRGQSELNASVPAVACYTDNSLTAFSFGGDSTSSKAVRTYKFRISEVWSCYGVWQTAHEDEKEWTLFTPKSKKERGCANYNHRWRPFKTANKDRVKGRTVDTFRCECDACRKVFNSLDLRHSHTCSCTLCENKKRFCKFCGVPINDECWEGEYSGVRKACSCCAKQINFATSIVRTCEGCGDYLADNYYEKKCRACVFEGCKCYYIRCSEVNTWGDYHTFKIQPALDWKNEVCYDVYLNGSLDFRYHYFATAFARLIDWRNQTQEYYSSGDTPITFRRAVYDKGWHEVDKFVEESL